MFSDLDFKRKKRKKESIAASGHWPDTKSRGCISAIGWAADGQIWPTGPPICPPIMPAAFGFRAVLWPLSLRPFLLLFSFEKKYPKACNIVPRWFCHARHFPNLYLGAVEQQRRQRLFFAAVLSSGGTCAMGNGWGNGAKAARVFGGGTVTTVSNGLQKKPPEASLFPVAVVERRHAPAGGAQQKEAAVGVAMPAACGVFSGVATHTGGSVWPERLLPKTMTALRSNPTGGHAGAVFFAPAWTGWRVFLTAKDVEDMPFDPHDTQTTSHARTAYTASPVPQNVTAA